MRYEEYALNVPGSATAGAVKIVKNLREKTVLVSGTFTATFDLEGYINGAWGKLVTGISTAGFHKIDETIEQIRVNVTAWTSSPTVSIAGRNSETGP